MADFIVWSDRFSVTSEVLDSQHRKLFGIVNNLHRIMQDTDHQLEQQEILKELAEYAESHFAEEERLMETHEFPGITDHQSEHGRFTQRIKISMCEFATSQADISFDLMKFLKSWLIDHVLSTDREYIPLLSKEVEHPISSNGSDETINEA